MSFFFGTLFFIALCCVVYFARVADKKRLKYSAWLALVFIIVAVATDPPKAHRSGDDAKTTAVVVPSPTDAPTESPSAEPKGTPEPVATPEPTEEPTPKPTSAADAKREFLQTVDESISGARIAGNKLKFVGTNVDLHGIVGPIVDEHEFNLMTGSISADDTGNVSDTTGAIVVTCNSTMNLEKGQRIRVMGTVVQPSEGTNVMGGAMTFPTVAANFME